MSSKGLHFLRGTAITEVKIFSSGKTDTSPSVMRSVSRNGWLSAFYNHQLFNVKIG